jgi:hypothetical protein
VKAINGTEQGSLRNGLFDYAKLGSADAVHQAGNTSAYDQAIRQVYMIGTVWGYAEGADEASNAMPVLGSLTCVRANRVVDGSRRLSAGTPLRAMPLWLMVVLIPMSVVVVF